MSKSFREKAEAKRTSAGNPALMFISQPQEQAQKAEEPAKRKQTKDLSLQAKKAAQKASKATQAPRAAQGAEAKSRRLQLLIQPSLYEEVKARAEAEGTSVNDQISSLLREALGI